MPVAIAGCGHGVDCVYLPFARAEYCDQQAARRFDRYRDRALLGIAVFSQQIQEHLVAGGIIGYVPFGDELAAVVDQGNVMGTFGPVNTAVDQGFPSAVLCPVHELMRATQRPNPRTQPLQPVRHLSSCSWHQLAPRASVYAGAQTAQAYQEITMRWARPTNTNERARPGVDARQR